MITRTMLWKLPAVACILALGLAFSACEELVDADGLPYVERLVVDAMLSPNVSADSIYIRRTLPLSAKYDSSKAMLADVTGYIEFEGQQYPLVHKGSSRYAATGLIPESGKRYKLVAQWRGRNVQAETRVPFAPQVDTVVLREGKNQPDNFVEGMDTLTAIVRPRTGDVYAMEAVAVYRDGLGSHESINLDYDEIIRRAVDVESDGNVHMVYRSYHIFDLNPTFNEKKLAIIYAFDTPFYDYYFSITNGDNDGGPFSSGTRPIYWNVQGDGIGIFMGRAITIIEL